MARITLAMCYTLIDKRILRMAMVWNEQKKKKTIRPDQVAY